MSDKAWKSFERWVCKIFGGKRRGPDFRGEGGGKNDCVDTPGWSIECKLLKAPGFMAMLEAALQAEAAVTGDEIPVAVIGKAREPRRNALVVMRVGQFVDWFGSEEDEE